MPKFAITLKNCIYHWKRLTLAHNVVFGVFINPFTFQERKIRGQNGIRKRLAGNKPRNRYKTEVG